MTRRHRRSGMEAGILSRQGELFLGGPAEGILQRIHPASRFLATLVLLTGISFCHNGVALCMVFLGGSIVATLSFLNLFSIYKIILVPVLLLAVPSWIVSTWWYGMPYHAGGLFFLRTLASVTVASVGLHSIGLRRIGVVLSWFRLPIELRQMWNIMVSQIAGFSELLSDMALARSARAVVRPPGTIVRRQVGRQMGILFSRTYQRGNQLGLAMDARSIADAGASGQLLQVSSTGWAGGDFIVTGSAVVVAILLGGLS